MDEPSAVRKTFQDQLQPAPEPERALAVVVRRGRELSTAAREERRDAWAKGGVSVSVAGQSAELPGVKAVRPEYRDIHSQVLQDVLTRLDKAYQACVPSRQERRGARLSPLPGREPLQQLHLQAVRQRGCAG
jgi:putative transposase